MLYQALNVIAGPLYLLTVELKGPNKQLNRKNCKKIPLETTPTCFVIR